jgi:hypothetical protein
MQITDYQTDNSIRYRKRFSFFPPPGEGEGRVRGIKKCKMLVELSSPQPSPSGEGAGYQILTGSCIWLNSYIIAV